MRAFAATMLVALLLTGCADPYAKPPAAQVPTVAGEESAAPVRQSAERSADAAATPEAAARRAVELAGNWTAETISARYERLARLSIGTARREAQQAAAQAT